MSSDLWQRCFHRLKGELPAQQFNTWIKPLEAEENDSYIRLLAPNRFIKNFVHDKFVRRIEELLDELNGSSSVSVELDIFDEKSAQKPSSALVSPNSSNHSSPPHKINGSLDGHSSQKVLHRGY